ncbi:MAG TPA: methyltransferase domain-containing protein [Acidimicrobiales bacterium]|nr:methyltransferase domain-containing protein [Acidimicrobiales bacterium]
MVPLFDEALRFPVFGPQLADHVAGKAPGSVLVFVDDGSADETPRLVDELVAARPDVAIRLLRRPHAGKGAAVAAGLRAVGGTDLGAFCDLDLSTPLADLDEVIEAARRADVLAIGSRDLTASTLARRESRARETLGRAYNRLLQATVTPGIVDTQCGAKAAPTSVWARLLPLCHERGFAWDAEVVAVAQALGIVVREVPIAWQHDDRSKVRVGPDGLAMVAATPRIWRRAREAAASAVTAPASAAAPAVSAAPADGPFEGAQADELIGADRSHWWFRGKAALVATALARTEGGGSGFLVDVGAGAGGVTAMLGWHPDRVVVLEAGIRLVHHARHAHGLPAVRAAASPLPLADRSVDVVCLLDVIEHLDDPATALVEARRVLRPGGRLVVNVPAHPWLWSAADVHLGHRRRYTRTTLRRELGAAGFDPVLLGHVFTWLVPAVWLERRVKGREPDAPPALGLDRSSFLVDRTAMVLTALERLTVGRVSWPVGTSLLTVAQPA